MTTAERNLKNYLTKHGLELPPPPEPFGVYRPTIDVSPLNNHTSVISYISGHGPMLSDKSFMKGKVGKNMSIDEAVVASRQTGLSILATLRNKYGTLNRVKRIIKSLVMVNSIPEFSEQITVANGYSELMKEIFGPENGVGVRSAIGVGSLPMHTPVEIELVVEFYLTDDENHEINNDTTNTNTNNTTLNSPALASSSMIMVDSVVNCCGHFTSLGGSRLHPKAIKAMYEVSNKFIDLNELLVAAGEKIKALCNIHPSNEYDAHVTTGASAGLALSVASCLARDESKENGYDIEIIETLPKLYMMKYSRNNIILIDGSSDTRWNQSMELTGAKILEIGTVKQPMTEMDLINAIKKYKKMICGFVYFSGGGKNILSIDKVVQICHNNQYIKNIPVIVDAAARLPPVSNLNIFTNKYNVDCVLFSGGKMLRGPQSSGFMIGKTWLINASRANACPNETTVGRPMKTSKESIVGLVAALEEFLKKDGDYPENVNAITTFFIEKMNLLLNKSENKLLNKYIQLNVNTGFEMHMTDIQPNMHQLIFINLNHFKFNLDHTNVNNNNNLYGDGVNHGSPMKIMPTSPGSYLAYRLANLDNTPRIAINTTENGLLLNPIVLTKEEAEYVCEMIIKVMNTIVNLYSNGSSDIVLNFTPTEGENINDMMVSRL